MSLKINFPNSINQILFKMKPNRNYITPFLSMVFFIVGISGLLMFFNLLDCYTEVIHEILGLFFVVCAIFHIILNWKALKTRIKKSSILPALGTVLTLSALLVISERVDPP